MKKKSQKKDIRKSFSFEEIYDRIIFHDGMFYQVNRIGEKCTFFIMARICEDSYDYFGIDKETITGCYKFTCRVKEMKYELKPEVINADDENIEYILERARKEEKRNLKYNNLFVGTLYNDVGYDIVNLKPKGEYIYLDERYYFDFYVKIDGEITIELATCEYVDRIRKYESEFCDW